MTQAGASPGLRRAIGPIGSGLLSFNGIVGASIFALPATLLVDWGTASPLLFLIVGLAALLVIIPFANSAAVFPQSGGPATYGLVYGRLAAFELGWVYYVARVSGFAANLNVLVDYVARWLTGAQGGYFRAALIVATCAALAIINIVGVKRAMRVLAGFTLLKTLPLILIPLAALVVFGPPPAPVAQGSIGNFEAAFLLTFYAFVGFENAVVPAGETKNPKLILPRAVIATTILTAGLYFLVQLAFVTVFDTAPKGSAPLVELGSAVAGPAGAILLTFAAICSLFGNLLAGTAAAPRITHAMGQRGDLPAWFGAVNSRFVTPANSIVFLCVIVIGLALSGSFVWLAVISTLARMIVYVATIATLPLAEGRPRLSLLHWLSGAVGIAICLWGAAQATQSTWMTFAALAAAGVPLYLIAASKTRRLKTD